MTALSKRDQQVMRLYEQLVEIERRLIPTGLHIFGQPTGIREKADLLRMVASFDRPERDARALPDLVAEALNVGSYHEILADQSTSDTKELIDGIVTEAVRRFCDGGPEVAAEYLASKAGVDRNAAKPTFQLLQEIAEQLEQSHELESLSRALQGEYIE